MNRTIAALLCTSLLCTLAGPVRAQDRAHEQRVIDAITAADSEADAVRINAESHYASTPGDRHIAEWMRDQLAAAGFNAKLETFNHDVPLHRQTGLEEFGGKYWIKYKLTEVPIPQDPDGTRADAGPAFNAWSGSGVAIANVVDAGHGLERDYDALRAHGVDVRTRIALIRYGAQFRGDLAKRAQDHGASGVIFFDDPSDPSGSQSGPAYPDGPYRPLGSIQRGALIEGAIHIPTLPITALNARRVLATMNNGISRTPYRLTVQMKTAHNALLWNTVGVLPGIDPTHTVIVGAHRDAWVYGVTDNGSGVSTVLQVARSLGVLYKSGWRPRYSIVLVGFDGEEIGEVGSNAYVRAHWGDLSSGCIAYINEDEITTGQLFGASAVDALRDAILPVTEIVSDPALPSQTLYNRWAKQSRVVQIRGPGGGSDFEPFLYELGIPVLSVGFHGVFGVYHSGFDDLNFASTQADPGFVNHRAVAQVVAVLAMRLADGTVPYHLSPYAGTLRSGAQTIAGTHMNDLAPFFRAIDRFAFRAAAADHYGMNGNVEIDVVRRLNKLAYGRSGYAAVPLPMMNDAIQSGNDAEISAAVGRAVNELDNITSTIAGATMR